MAVDRSYARLGLFLVIGLVVILATALLFIQRMRSREVIEMVTYTQENVSGLDVASSVRYRGVPVGRVTGLRANPGGRTIEIDFEVFTDRLTTIGLDAAQVRERAKLGLLGFSQLRTQVVSNPVTGEAYLFIDLPDNPPPPLELGFTPDRSYIPSMPTPLSALQDRVPAVLERAEMTLQTLRDIVTRIPDSLDKSDRFFTNVERIFRESELAALSADSRKFFSTTSAQIDQIAANLDGVIGKGGALVTFAEEARAAIAAADFPASNRATRDAMDQAALAADDLRRSLPVMRESLEELRELARQLQDQPESVVYGTRPAAEKSK
jgi:phospholipid/cholesterol/gamma-HCH transport system substrate-binding protein/paraquat-inducible protein B